MPEVVDYYDQEGNAIIQNTEKIRELINIKKQLYAQQKQETLKAQTEKDTNEYEIAYHESERLKNAQEKYEEYSNYMDIIKDAVPREGSADYIQYYSGRAAYNAKGDNALSYVLEGRHNIEGILGSLSSGNGTQSSEIISLIIEAIKANDEALYNQLTNNGELTSMLDIGTNLKDYIEEENNFKLGDE